MRLNICWKVKVPGTVYIDFAFRISARRPGFGFSSTKCRRAGAPQERIGTLKIRKMKKFLWHIILFLQIEKIRQKKIQKIKIIGNNFFANDFFLLRMRKNCLLGYYFSVIQLFWTLLLLKVMAYKDAETPSMRSSASRLWAQGRCGCTSTSTLRSPRTSSHSPRRCSPAESTIKYVE